MLEWNPLTIMSYGGGTPSTTLVLMACENKLVGRPIHPLVPEYDYVLFCDLHAEPSWVYRQAAFVANICAKAGINFVTLDADLYGDFTQNFGKRRVAAIPFWTVTPEGKQGKMPRQCTCDYKIKIIERFVRYELLGYRPKQNAKKWDIHAHEMHMGIMAEEARRAKESRQTLFVKALDTLTNQRRDIVLLSYLLGLTDNEISQCLGVGCSTVQYRRTSTLKQLRKLMEEYDHE